MDPSTFREAKKAGHEKADLPIRLVLLTLAGLVAGIVVSYFGVSFFMNALASSQSLGGVVSNQSRLERKDFPAPQLQDSPEEDLQAYQAAKRAELSSYGWVDRATGTVHVPIERAMEQLLKSGIAVRPVESGPTETEMIQQKGVPARPPAARDRARKAGAP